MNLVDVEADVIEHLDFATPCEIRVQVVYGFLDIPLAGGPREQPCPNTGVGLLRCQGCGVFHVACEPHRDRVLTNLRIQCQSCGLIGAGLEIWAFEPLKVRS